MSTDTGIDLVAYSPVSRVPLTIQVKTNLAPRPAGGTGPGALNWTVDHHSPAQIIALVDMSEGGQIWLFTLDEFRREAQQDRAPDGSKYKRNRSLHMYVVATDHVRSDGKRRYKSEFAHFALEKRVAELFHLPASPVPPTELSSDLSRNDDERI
ncbi:hypothetical protein QTH91_14515 [Variovorax dokdonensis]|uniref:Uncharacterized protein n=2 Tax=Variovorax dokdonensis TaxID=344883 RepID=A0ABT7NCT9_9BURK|nr:hypothetical protein [Variovorax dokdonensis]MDM0045700.1 hypothetical protein [Variovorax dokdonensis]